MSGNVFASNLGMLVKKNSLNNLWIAVNNILDTKPVGKAQVTVYNFQLQTIGKGKIEEVASLLRALDANGVICDDELSPSQLNNLERELDCKVMDRTLLILDIFARRAVSSEGKIQVELAQLRYRAARLVGLRESLSRLGGGIGTRGPGEKKLETDRQIGRAHV